MDVRDERFQGEQHYEWFKNYSHFRHLVLKHIKPTDRVCLKSILSAVLRLSILSFIPPERGKFERLREFMVFWSSCEEWPQVLEVGAGSSRLSEDMYRDGIRHITCTDLSTVAVERMRERFVDLPGPPTPSQFRHL